MLDAIVDMHAQRRHRRISVAFQRGLQQRLVLLGRLAAAVVEGDRLVAEIFVEYRRMRLHQRAPLVGVVLNVVCGVSRISMEDIIKGVWPFMIAQFVVLFLMVLFPSVVTVPAKWFGG